MEERRAILDAKQKPGCKKEPQRANSRRTKGRSVSTDEANELSCVRKGRVELRREAGKKVAGEGRCASSLLITGQGLLKKRIDVNGRRPVRESAVLATQREPDRTGIIQIQIVNNNVARTWGG
jgi:hypothetical protein